MERLNRNKAKRDAIDEQDHLARQARADKPILDAICVQALAMIKDAGGAITYVAIHAAIARATGALEVCYERKHIRPAGRGECAITPAGRAWLKVRHKTTPLHTRKPAK